MDSHTLDLGVFVRSLTEEQSDTCVSDEKQLGEIFSAGWSEQTAVLFHRAMLHTRRVEPDVTVEGLFEAALNLGLSFVSDEEILARVKQAREDDVIVYGVQRRDSKDAGRTACVVSPDVAALAKIKRERRGKLTGAGV